MASPYFVKLLLTRVSSVPLLEKKADTKWGRQEDYENYKKSTPVLIPRLYHSDLTGFSVVHANQNLANQTQRF